MSRLPPPSPTNAAASAVMRGNRRIDTRPEVQLRSILHRLGYRFRKHLALDLGDIRVRPDIVFTTRRLAIFVDGCFWHRCPEHGSTPRSNTLYWGPKLDRNVDRDRRVDARLLNEGWTVLRIWEHDAEERSVQRVRRVLDPESVTSKKRP